MSLSFAANNGTTWPFDGSTGVTQVGEDSGIFDIPPDLIVQQRTATDGGVLASSRYSPRAVTLEVMIEEQPTATVLQLWGQFQSALASGGKLIYDGPNGVRELREIVLEAPGRSMRGRDLKHLDVEVFPLSLLALDPWWYGTAQMESLSMGAAGTAFNASIGFNAAVPFNGGGSLIVTVEGDAPASPRFVMSGRSEASPAVTVGNGVVNWQWSPEMGAGSVVEVDARPGSPGPHLNSDLVVRGGEPQPVDWGLLTESSRLFSLPVGSTAITYQMHDPLWSVTLLVWWESRWFTP